MTRFEPSFVHIGRALCIYTGIPLGVNVGNFGVPHIRRLQESLTNKRPHLTHYNTVHGLTGSILHFCDVTTGL